MKKRDSILYFSCSCMIDDLKVDYDSACKTHGMNPSTHIQRDRQNTSLCRSLLFSYFISNRSQIL